MSSNDDSEEENILQEADRLVNGDRQNSYGRPLDDFQRTAKIWSGILGVDVSPQQVGMCMVGLKLSRLCNKQKRDSLVDIAGYAQTVHMVNKDTNSYEDKE